VKTRFPRDERVLKLLGEASGLDNRPGEDRDLHFWRTQRAHIDLHQRLTRQCIGLTRNRGVTATAAMWALVILLLALVWLVFVVTEPLIWLVLFIAMYGDA